MRWLVWYPWFLHTRYVPFIRSRLYVSLTIHSSEIRTGRCLSSEWILSGNTGSARNEYKRCLEQLELDEDCSLEEARNAYISLAKIYHPDSRSSRADSKQFSELRKSFSTIVKYKQRMKEWHAAKEEDLNPDLMFDIQHTAPQHRQFLELDGVGPGSVSQRQKSAQKKRFSDALDSVLEHRANKSLVNDEETAVGFHDREGKKRIDIQKRHRTTQTLVQLADDLIAQAIKRGEFDNLKGAGQPLNFSTANPYVDTHTKYLNNFLINSGYTLDWISMEKEIRETYERVRGEFLLSLKKHLGEETKQKDVCKIFEKRFREINKMIDDYNLQVPILFKQKFHYEFTKIYEEIFCEINNTHKV